MENSGSQNSDESGTSVGSASYAEEGDDELQPEASQETQSQSSENEESDKKQKTIAFDQEKSQVALAKLIIVDGLPFEFVENQGFRDFMVEAQPGFKIPSPITIASDCMQLCKDEKEKLKCMLSKNHQMVSLTTNTWSSIQSVDYMYVTAHYVDDEWELKKKIFSFGVVADNKGEAIGKSLEECLKDWGISKVCCVTVDNTSANNLAVAYLARRMSNWDGLALLNEDHMHMICCARIMNLVVSDGLKELDSSLSKIRDSCKYVKSSPARLAIFESCAQIADLTSKEVLTLDVPPKWDSTYMMLNVAENFEKAFSCI